MSTISIHILIADVESESFFARLAIINNIESFLIFLRSNSSIQELINFASIDKKNLDLIKERLFRLWDYECDNKKLHPYDHSIAMYLYVIFESNKIEIEEILEFINTHKLENLYWTYEICDFISKSLPRVITSFSKTDQISHTDRDDIIDIKASDSK